MNCLPCEQAARALKKAGNITEAWVNVIVKDPEVEALAELRMNICRTCSSPIEFMRINGNPIYKCKECTCPLIALVRSKEKCKLNKW